MERKRLMIEEIQTDLLIVGGGIAGCMAAIKAAENPGVKVMVAEKGFIDRSGQASTGVDHYATYIHEVHAAEGYTVGDFVKDDTKSAYGYVNQDLVERWVMDSYARFLDWERFGINIRDNEGNIHLIGRPPRRIKAHAHFDGQRLKVKLSKEVRKRKVAVVNRVMVTDLLLHEGAVAGALGIDTRQERAFVFRAKAVILATGGANRLYPVYPNDVGMFFNYAGSPNETGDGRVLAYKAGADLYNMELPWVHSGLAKFHRCGRFSYYPAGILRDGQGVPLSDLVKENYVDEKLNDSDLLKTLVRDGRGPIYLDCTGGTDKEIAYIKWALSNEGNYTYLRYLEEEGLDLKRNPIEFTAYEPWSGSHGGSGIDVDVTCATSVPGLFAAGDELAGILHSAASGAAALGWLAGEMASNFAVKSKGAPSSSARTTIEERIAVCSEILSRNRGAKWQEAQAALQNIMGRYVGENKYETMMEAGLSNLLDLREQAMRRLKAQNPHELTRALEVLNLMDIGEMVIKASLSRRDSVPGLNFSRVDFPNTSPDPLYFVFLKRRGEKMEFTHKPTRYRYPI